MQIGSLMSKYLIFEYAIDKFDIDLSEVMFSRTKIESGGLVRENIPLAMK